MKAIKKVLSIPSLFLNFLRFVFFLKRKEYKATFTLEGDIEILLPKTKFLFFLSKLGRKKLFNSYVFIAERPTHEPLFRKIVYELLSSGYVNKNDSLIDIGCWIGDSCLVWSKMLSNGKVFAIEGLNESLNFAKELAKINDIENIKFINAICSHKPSLSMESSGFNSGTSFAESAFDSSLKSTTIDEVIPVEFHHSIGLFHIDVEGQEENVIFGSKRVIESSRPVIIFEQHISSDSPKKIFDYLKKLNYSIFMVNEVISGNSLDCRNFIAVDSRKALPKFSKLEDLDGKKQKIWFATLGPSLIEV